MTHAYTQFACKHAASYCYNSISLIVTALHLQLCDVTATTVSFYTSPVITITITSEKYPH